MSPYMQPPCWYCMMPSTSMWRCPVMQNEIKNYGPEEDIRMGEKVPPPPPPQPCPPPPPCPPPQPCPAPPPCPPPPQPQPCPPPPPHPCKKETSCKKDISTINIMSAIEIEAPEIINYLIELGMTKESAKHFCGKVVDFSCKHMKKC